MYLWHIVRLLGLSTSFQTCSSVLILSFLRTYQTSVCWINGEVGIVGEWLPYTSGEDLD